MIELRNIEDRLIVELLKKTPDNALINDLLCDVKFNYNYFFEMISRHLVEAEVLTMLLKHKLPGDLKSTAAGKLKKSTMAMVGNNLLAKSEMRQIIKTFEKDGIASILMKGLSLDFTGLRTCRDLDILVRQQDLVRSIEPLKSLGYFYVGDMLNHALSRKERRDITLQFSWNNQYQFFNQQKNLLLEIHTNLFERRKIYFDNLGTMLDRIDDIWQRKVFDKELGVYIFSLEDRLILMCMHAAIKRSFSNNTFILRNVLDVDRIIRKGVDWELFLTAAGDMKISHYIYFSLLLAKYFFASDIPDHVFDRLKSGCSGSELFLVRFHFKCFKNFKYNAPLHTTMFKIISAFVYNDNKRGLEVLKRIFRVFAIPRWKISDMTGIRHDSPAIVLGYIYNPFRMLLLFFRNLLKRH